MGKRIELTMIRLAFADAVFETKRMDGSERDLYSVTCLFPPTHPAYKLIEDAAVAVAIEEWGQEALKGKDEKPGIIDLAKTKDGGKNWVLKDGSAKEYDGYAGNFYINPSNEKRPNVYDRDGSPLTAEDGVIYSGCYADAIVEVYAYAHKVGGKGVSSSFKGLRFRKDGDAFAGGAPVTADAFSSIAEVDDIAF